MTEMKKELKHNKSTSHEKALTGPLLPQKMNYDSI